MCPNQLAASFFRLGWPRLNFPKAVSPLVCFPQVHPLHSSCRLSLSAQAGNRTPLKPFWASRLVASRAYPDLSAGHHVNRLLSLSPAAASAFGGRTGTLATLALDLTRASGAALTGHLAGTGTLTARHNSPARHCYLSLDSPGSPWLAPGAGIEPALTIPGYLASLLDHSGLAEQCQQVAPQVGQVAARADFRQVNRPLRQVLRWRARRTVPVAHIQSLTEL